MLRDNRDGVVTEERWATCHHFVGDAAKRVEVRAGVGLAAEGLLRRHVGDGTYHHPLHRQPRAVKGHR